MRKEKPRNPYRKRSYKKKDTFNIKPLDKIPSKKSRYFNINWFIINKSIAMQELRLINRINELIDPKKTCIKVKNEKARKIFTFYSIQEDQYIMIGNVIMATNPQQYGNILNFKKRYARYEPMVWAIAIKGNLLYEREIKYRTITRIDLGHGFAISYKIHKENNNEKWTLQTPYGKVDIYDEQVTKIGTAMQFKNMYCKFKYLKSFKNNERRLVAFIKRQIESMDSMERESLKRDHANT